AVYVKDPKIFEELKIAADSTNFILHENPDFADYKEGHFIVCDLASFTSMKKEMAKVKKGLLYVLSDEPDESNMKLIEKHQLHHLVGLNPQTYASETVRNLGKAFSKKIWGLKCYLDEEAEVKIISLSDSKHTNEMIQESLQHFDFQDYFSS